MSEDQGIPGDSEPDGKVCPYCGNKDYSYPCDHMVGDWPDAGDNLGGLLAGNFSENEAFGRAGELALAICELAQVILNGSEVEHSGAKLERYERLVGDDPEAAWWDSITYEFMDQGCGPEWNLTDLGRYATPTLGSLGRSMPNTLSTTTDWDSMAGGSTEFLWGANPEVTKSAISDAIARAIESVRRITEALSN